MRIIVMAVGVIALSGVASSAPAPQYTFSFTVQVDDASPVALTASIQPGTSQTLQATKHLRIEIEAPTSTGDASITIVKLIDDSSGAPIELHTAHRVGPVEVIRTFGYAVCSGVAKFQSPLQAKQLSCRKDAS